MIARAAQQEHEEAIARLREWLKPGDTVYTIVRHVSRSGKLSTVSLKILRSTDGGAVSDRDCTHTAWRALGWSYDPRLDGIKVFLPCSIVEALGELLFGDENALRNRTL